MYRYTQVGSEFLLLQVIKKKNTPLISQLVRESIRTSFQTNAVFLVDIWILNPVFHACVMDPLHARTVAIRDFRVGNEIKLSNTLFRTPSSFCSLLFTAFPCTIDRDLSSSLTGPGAGSQISGPAPLPRLSSSQHPAAMARAAQLD